MMIWGFRSSTEPRISLIWLSLQAVSPSGSIATVTAWFLAVTIGSEAW